uniref:Uncharacterized protein n=1 Tax=Glossina austeni TaxID=7395 RepID=A0A1A9UEV3_GLOAU
MVLVSLVKVVIIVLVYEMERSSVEERTRRSSIYEEYWLAEYRDKHGQKYLLAKDLIVVHGNALQSYRAVLTMWKRFNLSNRPATCRRTEELFKPEPVPFNKSWDPQFDLNCMASKLTLADVRAPPGPHFLPLPRFRDSLQPHPPHHVNYVKSEKQKQKQKQKNQQNKRNEFILKMHEMHEILIKIAIRNNTHTSVNIMSHPCQCHSHHNGCRCHRHHRHRHRHRHHVQLHYQY